MDQTPQAGSHTLGNEAIVRFVSISGREMPAKVDTGATTSSLHATDVTINQERRTVSFRSPMLSDNVVTMDLDGAQEVHSADGGGQERPMVVFDIEVDNVPLKNVTFNLNDRSNMDTPILLGQNVLKAGGFVVDVAKEVPHVDQLSNESEVQSDQKIMEAIQVLIDNNMTLKDVMMYIRTIAVNTIKD